VRVLVAEDDQLMADVVVRGLRQDGMAVDLAQDGEIALMKASVNTYDVIVLDRDLPVIHGDDVCRALNEQCPGTRVLMLTAADSPRDIVAGLSLGADDYLSKPFSFPELIARLRALSRRSGEARPAQLTHGDIRLDPGRREVWRAGRRIDLTPKEIGVLEALMGAGGAVVSSEELLEGVWDENADPFTAAVRITMLTLRRKLGDPPVIETVRGAGYRI
jgi:two-component system response regulator VanR